MKIDLRPHEFVDLYEVLVVAKDRTDLCVDESLMIKLRGVILASLEKREEEFNAVKYKSWTEQESKKIAALEEENARLTEEVKANQNKT